MAWLRPLDVLPWYTGGARIERAREAPGSPIDPVTDGIKASGPKDLGAAEAGWRIDGTAGLPAAESDVRPRAWARSSSNSNWR